MTRRDSPPTSLLSPLRLTQRFGLLILVHVLVGNPHPHSSGFSLLITSAASKWFCLMDLVALTTDVFTAAINSFSGGNLYSEIARCEFAFCGTFVKPEEAQSVVRWSLQMVLRYWPEPCWSQTRLLWEFRTTRDMVLKHLVVGSHLKPCPGYNPSLHWDTNIPAVECQGLVEHSLSLRRKGK